MRAGRFPGWVLRNSHTISKRWHWRRRWRWPANHGRPGRGTTMCGATSVTSCRDADGREGEAGERADR